MIRVADVMSLDGAVVRLVVDLAEILSYKIGRSIAHDKQVIGSVGKQVEQSLDYRCVL